MSIANILIDALKDRLTPSDQTQLLTGFADLERKDTITRTQVVLGTMVLGAQDGYTIFHPSGARAIMMEPVGNAFFGSDIDDPAKTSLAIFSESKEYNGESMGAGDLLVGDNSDSKANMFWDASSGRLNFRGGTSTYVYIDTDGSIVATLGKIGGWTIDSNTIHDDNSKIILSSIDEAILVGAVPNRIVISGDEQTIRTYGFATGWSGWQIDGNGNAEFNNIKARGELAAVAFSYKNVIAVGSDLIVTKGAATLYEDFTSPSYTTVSHQIKIANSASGYPQVGVNDIIRIQCWSTTNIVTYWGTITALTGYSGYMLATVTFNSGTGSALFPKGSAVVNYGVSGSGIIGIEAGDKFASSKQTRITIGTHSGFPWSSTNLMVTLGDMYNTYGTGLNHRWGIGIGDYSSGNYLTYNAEVANQFKIGAGDGAVTIDETGLKIWDDAGASTTRLRWIFDDSGTERIVGGAYSNYGGTGTPYMEIYGARVTGDPWSEVVLRMGAFDWVSGSYPYIAINSAGDIVLNAETDVSITAPSGLTVYYNAEVLGELTVGDGSGAEEITINGQSGYARQLTFESGGYARWVLRVESSAESGSEAGSDFEIVSRYDGGSYRDTPFKIFRQSGNVRQNRTYFEGDYVSATQRIEDNLDNAHTGWSSHFDGSFYPASGWAWAGSPFIGTPGTVNETYSRFWLQLNSLTAGNRAFYYFTGSIPTSKTILPYFYNSSVPLFVGWRWDAGNDNNYVEVGWSSTTDGTGLPVFVAQIRSRAGGGAVTTTNLTPNIPAGVKLQPLKVNVEGTQWSNWSARPFIAGLYQFRWLSAHSSKTWTPTRFGLLFDNGTASSASYQSLGFDAFD